VGIDRIPFRGLGLFVAGLTLGFATGGLLMPGGVGTEAVPSPGVPHVGASNLWAQHAPQALEGARAQPEAEYPGYDQGWLRPNVRADFNPDIERPTVSPSAYVDRMASVIGHVEIGHRVYVAPLVSVRGDEGQPIHIGDESNLQDGVVLHGLETVSHGKPVPAHTYEVGGRDYAVYIGARVSLAHQSQVHGPAYVENDVFVGMQALVFKAHIGAGSVIEPAATVLGVHVPAGRYVPAGSTVSDQAAADRLPKITEAYAFREINKGVVHVNTTLAEAYRGRSIPARARDR
jgi:carbonic anhydrase/acetyltransferase-like protein (isoleucine patch superfamily)